jgi:hypothetical protein
MVEGGGVVFWAPWWKWFPFLLGGDETCLYSNDFEELFLSLNFLPFQIIEMLKRYSASQLACEVRSFERVVEDVVANSLICNTTPDTGILGCADITYQTKQE